MHLFWLLLTSSRVHQLRIPWKGILTSVPYWSALVAMSFQAVVYMMLLTKIPTYLATVLKFSMEDVSIFLAHEY